MTSTFKLVGDGSSVDEGVIALFSGAVYGITSVMVGHPLDTVKTKMQADNSYAGLSTVQSCSRVFNTGGIRGFYSGAFPPLMGSSIFRSVQFAAYGSTYAYLRDEDHFLRRTKLFGIEARVFVGGVISGVARSLVESPLDLIKTRRQTAGSTPQLISQMNLLKGFSATLSRNVLLMTTFFAFVNVFESMDAFVRGGLATTVAWTAAWPLDVIKSRMQSSALAEQSTSVYKELITVMKDGSIFRGYSVGILRSFVANGASLRMYQVAQEWARRPS